MLLRVPNSSVANCYSPLACAAAATAASSAAISQQHQAITKQAAHHYLLLVRLPAPALIQKQQQRYPPTYHDQCYRHQGNVRQSEFPLCSLAFFFCATSSAKCQVGLMSYVAARPPRHRSRSLYKGDESGCYLGGKSFRVFDSFARLAVGGGCRVFTVRVKTTPTRR